MPLLSKPVTMRLLAMLLVKDETKKYEILGHNRDRNECDEGPVGEIWE